MMKDTGIMTEISDDIMNAYTQNEYRSEKQNIKRDLTPKQVIEKICGIEKETMIESIWIKHCHKKRHLRALIVYSLRVICGLTFKRICEFFRDMSLSGIKRLSDKGYNMFISDNKYIEAFR